jgi:hypothetical protein
MSRNNIRRQTDDQLIRSQVRSSYHSQQKDVRRVAGQESRDYRDAFLEMYGATCSCCRETVREFLTIGYKTGEVDIRLDVRNAAYEQAVAVFRPDLYRVLCWNCNITRSRYGYCPHQKEP